MAADTHYSITREHLHPSCKRWPDGAALRLRSHRPDALRTLAAAGKPRYAICYTQAGHKSRFFLKRKPQFVTVGIL